jgi:uncharacterized membrane protein SpoIIM required for sporulation
MWYLGVLLVLSIVFNGGCWVGYTVRMREEAREGEELE